MSNKFLRLTTTSKISSDDHVCLTSRHYGGKRCCGPCICEYGDGARQQISAPRGVHAMNISKKRVSSGHHLVGAEVLNLAQSMQSLSTEESFRVSAEASTPDSLAKRPMTAPVFGELLARHDTQQSSEKLGRQRAHSFLDDRDPPLYLRNPASSQVDLGSGFMVDDMDLSPSLLTADGTLDSGSILTEYSSGFERFSTTSDDMAGLGIGMQFPRRQTMCIHGYILRECSRCARYTN